MIEEEKEQLSFKSEGARLVKFRQKMNLSQKELATILGTKQPVISFMEKGERPLSFAHLRTLRKKFNFNINWYCTGMGAMQFTDENKSTLISDVNTIQKDYEDLSKQYDQLKKIVYKLVKDVYAKDE
ncbi:Predicted transcriptional regulator [Sphingobacterium multivorum]|jgi:transcriptional regulator with XRE-family HTH domain|uniref:helix-turn-helix domain-containing protein n=1 Tax=Sphingobacterium multivorum TaxID=28454 RepID=UPI000E04EED9|nr:helix-turn-helix transcriptional regulator [Sphingobacterium multivorum]QQT43292.1 helix-turn-helix transcriptional regulator [Sphingobacterium multivorum]SUI98838.1 Predicted transcriptional regulator [Sphingobacterium multivorum]